MEEELKKNEERIRTMVDNIPGVVYRCLMDDAWTMLFISDEIEVLSGYPANEFLGENPVRTFASIMHEDDLQPVAKNAQKAVDERVPYTNEYRVIDKDGNVHWVYARGKAIYDEDGTPLYLDGTQHEPRAANTDERHHRLFRDVGRGCRGRGPRRDGPGSGEDQRCRQAPPCFDQ
jgi:PAS domain S-box-containing protein